MKAQLTHQDFDLFQAGILELNSFRDLTAFRQALPGIMLRLIPADFFWWNELLVDEKSFYPVDFVDHPAGIMLPFAERMAQVFPEHPFYPSFLGNVNPTPLMMSDFYPLEEFRKTRLYQVAHQPFEWNHQLSVPVILHPGLVSSINFINQSENFTERDREMLNVVCKHFKQAYENTEVATARAAATAPRLIPFQLTAREAEIGLWLAGGKSNPEIAAILGLSARTVEKHVEHIFAKLGVENRTTAAMIFARARGNKQ